MSKLSSGKEPRADARHVPSLSAEQASARLEKTLGARWRALSDAEKSRLVASARASFQEAEQRKRLAKADPGTSKPSADPARDTTHAPAERAPRERRDEARAAPEAASAQPPALVPEPTPAPSPADPGPPVKRKRGRPPKVKPLDAGAQARDTVAAAPAPASAPKPKKRKPNASPAGAGAKKPNTSVFIADGPPSYPPGGGDPAADPGAVLPGAAAVSLVAPDGVVASAVPPGGAPLLGRGVAGVVDGAFAGGYFLTVRVDGCLLRGLVWDPDDTRAT